MSPAGEPPHVLILGGTSEAYALAAALAGRPDLRITTSLAGATTRPLLPAGSHRIGGFGGSKGLAAWLAAERVALVVDASHPFAAQITRHALDATARCGCGYLRLERPGWQPVPGDRWRIVADLGAGLEALLGLGAKRIFAPLGPRAVPDLAGVEAEFVVRGIERPSSLPANVAWLGARGPFTIAAEERLFLDRRIDALLCRNSGGDAARAKLDAARSLGLPVVLIDRPQASVAGEVAGDVPTALAMLDALLADRGR